MKPIFGGKNPDINEFWEGSRPSLTGLNALESLKTNTLPKVAKDFGTTPDVLAELLRRDYKAISTMNDVNRDALVAKSGRIAQLEDAINRSQRIPIQALRDLEDSPISQVVDQYNLTMEEVLAILDYMQEKGIIHFGQKEGSPAELVKEEVAKPSSSQDEVPETEVVEAEDNSEEESSGSRRAGKGKYYRYDETGLTQDGLKVINYLRQHDHDSASIKFNLGKDVISFMIALAEAQGIIHRDELLGLSRKVPRHKGKYRRGPFLTEIGEKVAIHSLEKGHHSAMETYGISLVTVYQLRALYLIHQARKNEAAFEAPQVEAEPIPIDEVEELDDAPVASDKDIFTRIDGKTALSEYGMRVTKVLQGVGREYAIEAFALSDFEMDRLEKFLKNQGLK